MSGKYRITHKPCFIVFVKISKCYLAIKNARSIRDQPTLDFASPRSSRMLQQGTNKRFTEAPTTGFISALRQIQTARVLLGTAECTCNEDTPDRAQRQVLIRAMNRSPYKNAQNMVTQPTIYLLIIKNKFYYKMSHFESLAETPEFSFIFTREEIVLLSRQYAKPRLSSRA